ncbi:MAG: hypothetical protein LBG77_08755 [Dysgonamonadaceae bacterium]|jgi:hypothetical protein|nr:hypothetical protein [Dysgonamonadaceae bacterium]
MKTLKTTLSFIAILFAISASAQTQRFMEIYKDGAIAQKIKVTNIDSLKFADYPEFPRVVTAFPYSNSGTVGDWGQNVGMPWGHSYALAYELHVPEAGTLTIDVGTGLFVTFFATEAKYGQAYDAEVQNQTQVVGAAGTYYIILTRQGSVAEEDFPGRAYTVNIDFTPAGNGTSSDEYIEINGVKWAKTNLSAVGTFAATAYEVGAHFLPEGASVGDIAVPSTPIDITADPCPSGWHIASHADWDLLWVAGIDDDTHNFEYNGNHYWTPTSTSGGLAADTWENLLVFPEALYLTTGDGHPRMNLILRGTWSPTGWQYWGDNWAAACRCVKD